MSHGLLAAQRRVWVAAELEPLEKLTLLAIVDHWSRKQQQPFPSTRRLALLTGLARNSVDRAIDGLEQKGWMSVNRRKGMKSTYDLGPLFSRPAQEVSQLAGTFTGETGAADEPLAHVDTGAADEPASHAGRGELAQEVSRTGSGGEPELAQEVSHKEATKEPKKEPRENAGSKSRAKGWKRVPESWQPSDAHRQVAAERGKNFDLELAKFRDYEFKRSYTDADAVFRNWLRNDFKTSSRAYVPQTRGAIQSRGPTYENGAE